MPHRGAVWITPTIVSQNDPNAVVEIVPPMIVLYDNETTVTVSILVNNADEMSTGGALVIENLVDYNQVPQRELNPTIVLKPACAYNTTC